STPPADIPKKASSPTPRMGASVPSILAADLIITGDVKTDGDVQIDGRIDGNITAGNITIGEQGMVNGKIKATKLHVRGKITGKVDANSVELAETANVQADLTQDQLMIANGAFFDGKCARKSGKVSAKSAE
ncbi:MAG: polymer-forming cytoskeletal protein, partial [Litorimonas sp.]